MSETFLIVYNARPGSRAGEVAPELGRALEGRGAAAELWPTSPGFGGMSAIEPSRHRGILVVGGDGTFHCTLNGVRASEVPYGFLGTGTINVLSGEMAIPREPEGFAEMVLRGRTAAVPSLAANGRRCALFFESGFLGSIVSRTNEIRDARGTHGQSEFVAAALRTLPRSWGRPLRVALRLADGRREERRYSDVLITRARRYAGTIPLPVEPEIRQPLLERSFLSLGYRTRTPAGHLLILALGFLRLLPALRGLLQAAGFVETLRAVGARIEAPEAPVPAPAMSHIDAETFEGMPVDIAFEEGGFRLFVP